MSQMDLPTERPRPKRPLSIGAGALVVHDQRVLLVRSTYGVTKGRYLLPAGRVNSDELPDRAAGRETFEAVALLQAIQKTPYQPAAGAAYPRGLSEPGPSAAHRPGSGDATKCADLRRGARLAPRRSQ